jgi:hypothetical protein
MNLYNYVAGAPFPPGMPEGFSEWKFGRVDAVLFALAADQNNYFADGLAGRLQTAREFRGLVYSLGPENRDYLKCADFFRVPDFPSYIVVSYGDFRKFLCIEPEIGYRDEERERFWPNRDYRRGLSYYHSGIDTQGISHGSRLDYAIVNGDVLERNSSSDIEEKVLELARSFCEGKAAVDNSVLLVRSISRRRLDELKQSAHPLPHGTEITVLFSRPAWRHTEFERILYDAFISFGAATDDVLVRILYPSYISDEYAKCRAKYNVVKLPAAIFCLGQTGQLVVKVERDFFERMPDLGERVAFLISDIHYAIANGHTTVAKGLVNELSSAVNSQAIAVEESVIVNGMNVIQLRPGSTIIIHERENSIVEYDKVKGDAAEEVKEGAMDMSNVSPGKMPAFGERFLEPSERMVVIKIVEEVVENMSTMARKNLLVNSRVPKNVLGLISYSDNLPTNNVAKNIVMVLEGKGALNPDTHILGAFLNQVIAETADNDACAYLVAIIFRYGLLRNGEQVSDLSSRFQVLSPKLTTEFYSKLSLAPLPERLSPSNYPEKPIRILHLGDLHFTAETSPPAKLQWLLDDIRKGEGLGFETLDYLVISGDVTDKGREGGFESACEFVSLLIKEFNLSAKQCILVPGNHDLEDQEESYSRRKNADGLKPEQWVQQGVIVLARNEEKYPLRLKRFSDTFFQKILQQPYPLDYSRQGISYLFPDTRIQFLTLNSCWQIDEFNRKRSGVHPDAVAHVIREADKQVKEAIERGDLEERAKILRVGVWHHAVAGPEMMQNTDFIGHLQNNGVKIGLHGDVHEIRREIIDYWQEKRVFIVGAGSFGSPPEGRPESTSRLYNLLEVRRDFRSVRVHTRSQLKSDSPWRGYYEWPMPDGGVGKLPYYDIDLK